MSLQIIIVIVSMLLCGEAADVAKNSLPNIACDTSQEGKLHYNAVYTDTVWICKKKEWMPYKISPSIGAVKSLSASSCNIIKQQLFIDCTTPGPVTNRLYWVQGMQVYCDMTELDGGGWTLVWQHSPMEDLPLNFSMRFFSEDYTPCVARAAGWCNIPNKARFNPTSK